MKTRKTATAKTDAPHLTSAPTAEDLLRRVLLLDDNAPKVGLRMLPARLRSDIDDFLANQSGDPYEEQV